MIHIAVALAQEAKPLIRHWKLKRSSQFSNLYFCADKLLVVSGMGMVQSACGVGFLVGLTGQKDIPKLNIGVAGHPFRDLGSMSTVHKILEPQTSKTFYPGFSLLEQMHSLPLKTVAKPVRIFDSTDCLVDMEGAGFFESASLSCNVEQIALCKVVSDNQKEPFDKSRIAMIPEMIGCHLDAIDNIVNRLTTPLSPHPKEVTGVSSADLKANRFSVTQTHELNRLLQKWNGLECGPLPDDILRETDPGMLLELFRKKCLAESKKMSF